MFPKTISCAGIFLFLLFSGNNQARDTYHVHSKAELRYTLESIFYEAWKKGLRVGNPFYTVYLHTGNYSISPQNNWYKQLIALYEKTRVLKVQPHLEVFSVYPETEKPRLLVAARLRSAVLTLESHMKEGLKVTSTVRYDVYDSRQFYNAVYKARYNKNDTVIHLKFCDKENCVQDFQVLDALAKLRMPKDDGMDLRIQSRYVSKEYSKMYFYEVQFYPFVYSAR